MTRSRDRVVSEVPTDRVETPTIDAMQASAALSLYAREIRRRDRMQHLLAAARDQAARAATPERLRRMTGGRKAGDEVAL